MSRTSRQLLRDQSFANNTARMEEYCRRAEAHELPSDRATFYRRLSEIRAWHGQHGKKPEQIRLKYNKPPVQERPPDSPVLPTGGELKVVEPKPVEPKVVKPTEEPKVVAAKIKPKTLTAKKPQTKGKPKAKSKSTKPKKKAG
jgi:hypothetical protein